MNNYGKVFTSYPSHLLETTTKTTRLTTLWSIFITQTLNNQEQCMTQVHNRVLKWH